MSLARARSFWAISVGLGGAVAWLGCNALAGIQLGTLETSDSGVSPPVDSALMPDGYTATGSTDATTAIESGVPEAGTGGAMDASGVEASADVGPDAPRWSPTSLDAQGKMALWLEASAANLVISSGVVGAWNDLSKNANNATNPSGGPQVETGVVNGLDAVHFNARAVTLTINDAPSLQFGTDQFFMAVVARASTSGGYFFSKVTAGVSGGGAYYASGLEFFVSSDAQDDAGNTIVDDAGLPTVFPAGHVSALAGNEVDWIGPAFDDNAYHVVIFRRTSAQSLSVSVDSRAAQTALTGQFDVSQIGQAVSMGGVVYGNRASPVDLSIAEMLVVHSATGVIADSDVALVQGYLSQKYAL